MRTLNLTLVFVVTIGTYSVASGTTYEAENGSLGGSATLASDGSFSGGRAVGFLGGFVSFDGRTHLKHFILGNGGTVTINNVQSNGGAHWVALYYANGDSTWRNVTVRFVFHLVIHRPVKHGCLSASVNGGSTTLVDQPDTGGGHVILSVPVKLNLNNGANSITFGSGQTSKSCGKFLHHIVTCKLTSFQDYAADLDKIIVY